MRINEWLAGLDYRLLSGSTEAEVEEVVYDSRKAGPGAVFVCMEGTNVDSHDFCRQVYAAGTRVFVTDRPVELPADASVIQVENGRKALALLSAARFGHPASRLVTIGVTGTKGKTTTTHMIRAILEAAGEKTGMIGTNGVYFDGVEEPTRNTTPESYELHRYFARMVHAGCRYLVMEVSSQALKLQRTAGICFDYAVFTNLSPDHIGPGEHADFAEYLACKAQLFRQCRTGIVNADDPWAGEITARASCPVLTYGIDRPADFRGENVRYLSEAGFVGLAFDVSGKASFPARVGIPGRFNASNALAAVSVCSCLNLSGQAISNGLEQIHVNGRMEIAYASDRFQVIIDYAHNAVSMESLLKTLRHYHPKRLVVVFGCGGNRAKDRRYSMGEIAGKMADLSIITADNSRFERTEDILADIRSTLVPTGGDYLEIPDRREAIRYAIFHAQEGDMIAVIGKGHEDYQEINGVRTHFLDREVVDEAVSQLQEGSGKQWKTSE